MTTPDVTVIVAVYNTMPYLTECMNSLVEQTIGRHRMEIIAVDDGSTDGGGKELDGFEELYPGTVRVLHQENSGGPAKPSNRALELAAGRYVYFVGADDRLGAEALERMVQTAEDHDSDIVVGKVEGVNDRYVHQGLFKENRPEVGFTDSPLPWSLSNCKLFRRDLIERHGLRFPESMPVCSDQPFTIEACFRARRISVLADYTCYYAVRRTDSSNITWRTAPLTHLEAGVRLVEFTTGLIPAGPARNAILRRHFTWEVGKLVGEDFPKLEHAVQEEVCARIARVCDEYLTAEVLAAIDVKRRVRLTLARLGAIDTLCAAIRHDVDEGAPLPVFLADDRAYLPYPGFDDEGLSVPRARFDVIDGGVTGRVARSVDISSLNWETDGAGRRVLTVALHAGLTGPRAVDPAVVRAGLVPMKRGAYGPGHRRLPEDTTPPEPVEDLGLAPAAGGAGTDISISIPQDALLAGWRAGEPWQGVRLYVDIGEHTCEIPVPAGDLPPAQARRWHRRRLYRLSAIPNGKGRLVVAIAPIRPTRVVARRLRRALPARRSGRGRG